MRNILLLSCFLASQIVFAQLTITEKEQVKINAETLLKQAIELNDFVGVSAGVAQNGDLIWKGGAGWSDRANQIPAESNMLQRTASIAKPMTAIAIMQLVEHGKLDLDVPIQTYLPEFPKKPEGEITTLHLLNHTSGIKHYKNKREGQTNKHYPTLLAAINTFKDRDLAFSPGTGYQYTTYGYVVLGAIIEKVSGQDFGTYMKENVWSKANMNNTSLEIKGQSYPNKTELYLKLKNKVKDAVPTDLSLKYPGGGMQTTVEDLLNFGHALLNNDLVSAETFERMLIPTDKKKQGVPYGLGFKMYGEHPKYGSVIGHNGAQAGTSTQLVILLDQGIVAAVLSNTKNSDDEVWNLVRELYELTADEEKRLSSVPLAINLPKSALKRYEGAYQFPSKSVVKVKREKNYLMTIADFRRDYPAYPQSENTFFFRIRNAVYEFQLDEDKKVIGLKYITGEKETFAKKID